MMQIVNDYYQLSVVGPNAVEKSSELQTHYLPNVLFSGGMDVSLPVLSDKQITDETMLYVCYDGTCLLPTKDVQEALRLVIQ